MNLRHACIEDHEAETYHSPSGLRYANAGEGARATQSNAVVIVVFVAMAQIPHRTHGSPVLRVVNLDVAIHVRQFDVRSAIAEFSAEVMAHEVMMVHMQAEIVVNPA